MANDASAIDQPQGASFPDDSGEGGDLFAWEGSREEGGALPFLLVGVAAPGNASPCLELFGHLPSGTGIAFVVLPDSHAQDNNLTELLSQHSPMRVREAADGATIQPDSIYVLPSGVLASLGKGAFRVADGATQEAIHPIDHFFHSLATTQNTHAIGVVLSGANGDGALGLGAIKSEGGIAIAQCAGQAAELPASDIPLDYIDRILTPEQIAAELTQIGRRFQPTSRTLEEGGEHPLKEMAHSRILKLLQGVAGIDFRFYKSLTVRRRIERRMLLNGVETLAQYAGLLQNDAHELRAVHEEVLIPATRFFRDPEVFEAFRELILPRMLTTHHGDEPLRIWAPGCSSGEEVYSLAICLQNYLPDRPFDRKVQIFGTDAGERCIQKAGAGLFPASAVRDISPRILERFFTATAGGYRICQEIREWCVFAQHDLLRDPPMGRVDLVCCRNVLVNFTAEAQEKILGTFHDALRPGGFLLLGLPESTCYLNHLFQPADCNGKFFVKIASSPSRTSLTVTPQASAACHTSVEPLGADDNWTDRELQRAAERMIVARYGPPGVVIDQDLKILQSLGRTAAFLEMPSGPATLDLTRMLRHGLAAPVSQTVHRAMEEDRPARVDGLQVSEDGVVREVSVEVLPIRTTIPRSGCFLVLFAPSTAQTLPSTGPRGKEISAGDRDALLEQLRQDLSATNFYLQTLMEERDARHEGLVLANEEVRAANQAVHSADAKLVTVKEELHNAEKELRKIGGIEQRNTALSQTAQDLSNLLNSANLPVLLLGNDLELRHFSAYTQRLINIRPQDIGRPFTDIRLNLRTDNLEPIFQEVLKNLTPREMEVQDGEGRWYLLRVAPHRTPDNRIDGLVVVFVDIDQMRRSRQELRTALDLARLLIESLPLPLAVIDLGFRIRMVNEAFRNIASIRKGELDGRSLPDLALALWDMEEPLRSHLENLRASMSPGNAFSFEHVATGEAPKVLNIRGSVLHTGGDAYLVVTFEDMTAQKEMQRLLTLERERLAEEVSSTARELSRAQKELRALAASLFTSQEEERRRVARELHDDICQKLALLEIDAQQAEPKIEANPGRARKEMERLRTAIGDLSEDVRRISHGLHPSVLEDLGIAPAIRSLVQDFGEREEMIVTFRADHIPDNVPLEIATGIYRVAQEALRNVAKHAGRTHVKVLLTGEPSRLRLQVIDSGNGFDPQLVRSGLGFISTEERTRIMRGTLSIESKLGEGTRVCVDVPLP